MKIMDRLSRLLGVGTQAANEFQCQLLDPVEICLIVDGHIERLTDFAVSPRLHLVDPKGDSPLHLAARTGNLALCDLFIRAGADPKALNNERQMPAEVAFAEGHHLAAQLLSSLITAPVNPAKDDAHNASPEPTKTEPILELPSTVVAELAVQNESLDSLDDLLSFEEKETPEDFFSQSICKKTSGTFVPLVSPTSSSSNNSDIDWTLDLSPEQLEGEGINSSATPPLGHGEEHDFLKIRNRGRASVKHAVIQTGTRLFIDPETCMTWARSILEKGWFSIEDMEVLVAQCEGNGDPEELRTNLQRNLEAAGLDLLDHASLYETEPWDAKSDISPGELAEAIEAALTRATQLPGTQRFIMDKSVELQLLEPMVRAKQELQLRTLSCSAAVTTILSVVDRIRDGIRSPESVSLKSIIPTRRDHAETAEFFAAADELRLWHANGSVMDGKRRREALVALEELDLSLTFHKEIVKSLEQLQANLEDATRLDALISIFEAAMERLIREHLPYARRFSSRNVEENEDPEDVFQVAFMGLQRSTRRFDPERGVRFVIYCTFWMKQALVRWRADEGAAIRIPVHRHENLAKLDRAMDSLSIKAAGAVTNNNLAAELGWTAEEVRLYRRIPREIEYPESIEAWDNLIPEQESKDLLDQAEIEKVVANALAELQERQADVIRMRFGIGRDAEMTLEEIGQLYGLTRERIRQIEAKALRHLAHPSRKRHLQALLGI